MGDYIMKKICIVILLIFFLFTNNVLADDLIEDNVLDEIEVGTETVNEPNIFSKYAIVMERTTGTILYEKDAYTKCAMASTTKILTAIIAIEKCELNDMVLISKKAAQTGGSTLGITANTEMTMESLLYGLLLRSGNDCAVAIAEYIGQNLDGFAKLMNKKAKEVGMEKSNFVTPHGLDNENHYTTAYDMAILTEYALQNEVFLKFVNTKEINIIINGLERNLNNTHELLGNVSGVYGVKTGFTGNAGRCLITAVKRDNLDIIIVILGADTKKIRSSDTQKLINYIYNNYEMIDTYNLISDDVMLEKILNQIKIVKSVDKCVCNVDKRDNYIFPVNKNEISKLKMSIYALSLVKAPIAEGTKVGEIRVMVSDNILYILDVRVSKKMDRKTWNQYMIEIILNFKNYF